MAKKGETAPQEHVREQRQSLKIGHVAEIIDVEYSTAKKLMEDGAIRSFKLKTQLKTTREEVMQFLRECVEGTITHEYIKPVKPFVPQVQFRNRKSS